MLAVASRTEGTAWAPPPPVCSSKVWARATATLDVAPETSGIPWRGRMGWSPQRVREFAAGRRCAAQALADAGSLSVDVGVGLHREPLWPPGFVGSITHSREFAFAAVGRGRDLASLGIDSEPVLDEASFAEVASLAFHAQERDRVAGRRDLATAVFSAKESLFKCVYPLARVFFDYLDAEVASLEFAEGRGVCRLVLGRDLGEGFARGRTFDVAVALVDDHLHACAELAP
jgi:enterobactin synthetase component D